MNTSRSTGAQDPESGAQNGSLLGTESNRDGDNGQNISFQTSSGHLTVSAIAEGAMRVRFTPNLPSRSEGPPDPVLIHIARNVSPTVKVSTDDVKMSTSRLSVTYDKGTDRLRFSDTQGTVFLEELREVEQSRLPQSRVNLRS